MSARSVLAVLALLAGVYVAVVFGFGYGGHVYETMGSLPDARQYLAVADWLIHGTPTAATRIRPFVYPLLVGLSGLAGGAVGTWIVQVAFWLGGGLLLSHALTVITRSRMAVAVGVAAYATNLTLLLLTLYAMPETLVTFLLAAFVVVVVARRHIGSERTLRILLALSAVLTATKPVYIGLFLPLLGIEAVRLIPPRPGPRTARFAWIVAACLPVIVQLGVVAGNHGVFGLSTIGGATVRRYACAELYRELHGGTLAEARTHVEPMSDRRLATMVLRSPAAAARVWLRLVSANIRSSSPVTDLPTPHPWLSAFMRRVNLGYLVVHLAMIVPTLALLGLLVRTGQWNAVARLAALAIPFAWIITTSGLTFWQGDRIVLPSLPVWIALDALVLTSWWGVLSGWKGSPSTEASGAEMPEYDELHHCEGRTDRRDGNPHTRQSHGSPGTIDACVGVRS